MATPTVTTPAVPAPAVHAEEVDRYEAVRQYSIPQIAALWVAAAAPMAILAWIIAPWLSHHLGTTEPLGAALLICFNAGLLWILVLTLIMVRLEQGGLGWARVRDALWLRAPQDPKTGRVGGKVWWWLVPFVLLSAALEMVPINPTGPVVRDFPDFITNGGDRVDRFYQGAWGLFALSALVVFLSPVVEELFFRGLMLPRMRKVCGRFDWVVNGTIFTAYHLHEPWVMPTTLLTGIFGQAYPAKRFRSIWISIAAHTLPSFVMIGVILSLVLK
jgi:membrane protease YdiL (CAAX protease family)